MVDGMLVATTPHRAACDSTARRYAHPMRPEGGAPTRSRARLPSTAHSIRTGFSTQRCARVDVLGHAVAVVVDEARP